MKVLHSICQQIRKIQQWPQKWEWSIFIPISKKGNAKECPNYHTTAFISHTSKVMLKFCRPVFHRMWTVNFQMFNLDLEKAAEQEIKLPTSVGSSKKQESSRKTRTSALLTMPTSLTVRSQQNVENSERDGNTRPPNLPREICMQARKQQLELNVEEQTGPNREMNTSRLYIVTLLI